MHYTRGTQHESKNVFAILSVLEIKSALPYVAWRAINLLIKSFKHVLQWP